MGDTFTPLRTCGTPFIIEGLLQKKSLLWKNIRLFLQSQILIIFMKIPFFHQKKWKFDEVWWKFKEKKWNFLWNIPKLFKIKKILNFLSIF